MGAHTLPGLGTRLRGEPFILWENEQEDGRLARRECRQGAGANPGLARGRVSGEAFLGRVPTGAGGPGSHDFLL